MRRVAISAILVLAALPTAAAGAAGGPVIGSDGRSGVLSPDGASRFVTFYGSHNTTVLARLSLPDAKIERQRLLRGFYMIPAVAYDGTSGGLSADGRSLVLIEGPAYPQRKTSMIVLDTVRLSLQRRLVLDGQFGYDASSPDGSRLFLTEYLSRRDPTRYNVRALDVATGRLSKPLVDPREPDEKMAGLPLTRATSPAGRWAYTLYDGSGGGSEGHPFIHALDTVRARAFCIDLDALAGRDDLGQLRLRVEGGGGRLAVVKDDKPELVIDTKTMAVSEPAAKPSRPAKAAAPKSGGDGSEWLVSGLLALALLVATGFAVIVRSRRVARNAKAR